MHRADPIVERIQGGLIEPYEAGYTLGSPEYYAAMPRDPQALLDWYWDYNGLADEERATEILAQALIFDLEINAAPADLRASMFRALSLIEGVAVQSVEGVVTTLSIDVDPDGTRLVTLSIDMETGLVVGSSVTRGPGGAVIPDGVPGPPRDHDDGASSTRTRDAGGRRSWRGRGRGRRRPRVVSISGSRLLRSPSCAQ